MLCNGQTGIVTKPSFQKTLSISPTFYNPVRNRTRKIGTLNDGPSGVKSPVPCPPAVVAERES